MSNFPYLNLVTTEGLQIQTRLHGRVPLRQNAFSKKTISEKSPTYNLIKI